MNHIIFNATNPDLGDVKCTLVLNEHKWSLTTAYSDIDYVSGNIILMSGVTTFKPVKKIVETCTAISWDFKDDILIVTFHSDLLDSGSISYELRNTDDRKVLLRKLFQQQLKHHRYYMSITNESVFVKTEDGVINERLTETIRMKIASFFYLQDTETINPIYLDTEHKKSMIHILHYQLKHKPPGWFDQIWPVLYSGITLCEFITNVLRDFYIIEVFGQYDMLSNLFIESVCFRKRFHTDDNLTKCTMYYPGMSIVRRTVGIIHSLAARNMRECLCYMTTF